MRFLKNVFRKILYLTSFINEQQLLDKTDVAHLNCANSIIITQNHHSESYSIQHMKRNLLCLSLVLSLMLLGGFVSLLAQSPEERDRARAEQMLAQIESKVTLDAAQKEKIREVLLKNQLEFRAEREQAKGDKLLLFRLANERLKKIDDDIAATLRPDQKSGYEAAKEDLRQSMRERKP